MQATKLTLHGWSRPKLNRGINIKAPRRVYHVIFRDMSNLTLTQESK